MLTATSAIGAPSGTKIAQKATRYDYIDALRGVAAILVFCVHFGQALSLDGWIGNLAEFGQYGVQLFFVLSAYTLCLSAKASECWTGAGYLSYLTRRLFRIAPLYYAAIIGYFWIGFLACRFLGRTGGFTPMEEYDSLSVVSNVLFFHGLYPKANNNMVPGGWSIGCEVLFYVVFPYVFLVSRDHGRKLLVLAAGIVAVTYLVVGGGLLSRDLVGNNRFVYYSLWNQAPCFILGVACFRYGFDFRFRKVLGISAFVALAAIVPLHSWPLGFVLTPVCSGIVASALLLFAQDVGWPRILGWFGRVSYSIYLSHFVIVWGIGYVFKRALNFDAKSYVLTASAFLVAVVLTAVVSLASSIAIEKPMIRLGRTISARLLVAYSEK